MFFRSVLIALAAVSLPPSIAWATSCTKAGLTSPISEMNVNNMFPITIAGNTAWTSGGARNCSAIASAGPYCVCPGRIFGAPTPGVIVTMHLPAYIAEVQGEAGCSPLLETKITDAYDHRSTSSEHFGSGQGGSDYRSTRQVHWVEYPVFSLLEMFKDSICLHGGNYLDIAYMTEFDPLWQNDEWAAVSAPEAALFANYLSSASCVIDTVSATFTRCPMDPMIWCVGSSHSYPWTATQNSKTDHTEGSVKVLQKFLQRQTRFGLLQKTVGSEAMCAPTYSPVMTRSQYRIDLIHPNPSSGGQPKVLGTDEMFWMTPAAGPLNEGTMFLIWQGMQCCMHI